MKLHIGADKRGIVHTVTATDARAADITQLPQLLHGQEREIFGDQAYWKEADRQAFTAQGVRYRGQSTSHAQAAERTLAPHQSGALADPNLRREHAFRVIKQLWSFTKVRYRGLAKNLARAHRPI